jgi:hypothetical protein
LWQRLVGGSQPPGPEPYCYGVLETYFVVVSIAVGSMIGFVLLGVSIVKTVRVQGWGKQTWHPTALPWFVAGAVVLLLTLLAGVVWASV